MINLVPLYPYLSGNVTHNNEVCIPIEMFTKLMADSQVAFAQAVVCYIIVAMFAGIAIGAGVMYVKQKIDESRARDH